MLLSFQKLNSFIKINEGEYELVGDLTLHGVAKSVKLMKDPWGNTKMAFIRRNQQKRLGLN
jgi:polyisoprenoid-binding protein YceI